MKKRLIPRLHEKISTLNVTKISHHFEKVTIPSSAAINSRIVQLQSQLSQQAILEWFYRPNIFNHKSNDDNNRHKLPWTWVKLLSSAVPNFSVINSTVLNTFLNNIMLSISEKIEKVEDVTVKPMPSSNYVQPLRMEFKQNGKKRIWDFVKLHQGVAVILFNTTRNVLVLVKQFRPAVYYGNIPQEVKNPKVDEHVSINSAPLEIDYSKYPASTGITLECCAGIIDKPHLNPAEIVKQETLEECGYDVPIENFQFLNASVSNIGVNGEKLYFYYAEITDAMKVSDGGGNEDEGELIEVVEYTIPEIRQFITNKHVNS